MIVLQSGATGYKELRNSTRHSCRALCDCRISHVSVLTSPSSFRWLAEHLYSSSSIPAMMVLLQKICSNGSLASSPKTLE